MTTTGEFVYTMMATGARKNSDEQWTHLVMRKGNIFNNTKPDLAKKIGVQIMALDFINNVMAARCPCRRKLCLEEITKV